MKDNTKGSESFLVPQVMKSPNSSPKTLPKYALWFILFIFLVYLFYTLNLIYPSHTCTQNPLLSPQPITSSFASNQTDISPIHQNTKPPEKTQLHHVVFGIAASEKLWHRRKNYIKLWWRPREMRGFVWLDKPVLGNDLKDKDTLPSIKISSNVTSKFKYTNKDGHPSAIRISRIVSETVRLGLEDVRWIVMGDDDTFFVVENLVRVLNKYDHNQFYYIGSSSESHLQNIYFSYNMAYGGGGFAISYALAKALEKMQDRCIERYPDLYGSDDRVQACMAELGVPLTKEVGFHQFDVYGNLFGLLAAHPIAPIVSLHHLDVVEPIFPYVNRAQALERLKVSMKLDSAGLMQQSICYDKAENWTVSVSWGYAVQIFQSIVSARKMEIIQKTFLNWYKHADYTAFAFNTRAFRRNSCLKPSVYMLSNALYNPSLNRTASEYFRYLTPGPKCKQGRAGPLRVEVYKKPDPYVWDKAPRRLCCKILPSEKNNTMVVDVGNCGEDEIIAL
ncbi:Beta-1,3-glucosyltransferase [Actinidia chinensis var. chinensis]|uniref:Beta-1,3-glucosyltransferase n=1 Tax=Actinidia chinensis var. chinensis TaxID=1590841 RepID=A0A2R6Q903_ACTCC|nr:Beta-1,3-glucosyltransferase [Actinidia chinensis var. chinensis]